MSTNNNIDWADVIKKHEASMTLILERYKKYDKT
jgi:hypothetical protein